MCPHLPQLRSRTAAVAWASVLLLIAGCGSPGASSESDEPKTPPAVATPKPAPPAVVPSPVAGPSLDDWIQDLEVAKKTAAAEKKDLLIVFLGPDGPSQPLTYDVLLQPEFRQARSQFVPVLIHFPRDPEARAKVQDPVRNLRLKQEYRILSLPRVVVADAEGRPYAFAQYTEGGAKAFLAELARLQKTRENRDQLFRKVETVQGAEQAAAIKQAVEWLNKTRLVPYYAPTLDRWLAIVEKLDPKNEHGAYEAVFGERWMVSLVRWMGQDQPDDATGARLVEQLEAFMAAHRFQDADLAAQLHFYAGGVLAKLNNAAGALRHFDAGLACRPKDFLIRERLVSKSAMFRGLGAGSGFVVAPGLLLTNHHVIAGPARVLVRVPSLGEPLEGTILAQDAAQDVALVKFEPPAGISLPPIPLAEESSRRGDRVLAVGFPQVTVGGEAGLKLTQGIVSATPGETPERMLVLDCRVNPGNSGGPLCDVYGNAVGMVTAKSVGRAGVESYGMALPADVLRRFVLKHVRPQDMPAPKTAPKPLEWNQVDRLVSPSVLMILRALQTPKE